MSMIRLEYNTEQRQWTLKLTNATHELTLPVLVTVPDWEEYLGPDESPIEIELPPYATLTADLAHPLSALGTPTWAQGGTLKIQRPGGGYAGAVSPSDSG